MQVLRNGESRRFEMPAWFDQRIAIVIGVVIAAGMAGHLLFQAFAPGKAGAEQSHPSSLAVDTQPAVYLTPLTPPSRPVIVPAMKPDIDIQPHVPRKHRKHRAMAAPAPSQGSGEVNPESAPKEPAIQGTEPIDGTESAPKKSEDDGPPAKSNFNGLDG